MEQNIISLGFDLEKFSAEKKIVLDGLLDIYDKSKVISGNAISPGDKSGWAELSAKVNAHQNAITQLQDANVKLAQTTAQLSTATVKQTTSLEQNIDARKRMQGSMASYIASQKEDLELLRKGVITRGEYNKRLIESDIKVEQYKNKISALNKEIKTQTQTTAQLGGAYGILSKEYLKAQALAKNLAVEFGMDSKAAKDAALNANALADKLKAIDATVGQHQRNVGNYTSALDKLGAGFGNVARRIVEYASVYAILGFFKNTVTEAMDAEKATTRFQATLENLDRSDVFERLESKATAFTDKFKYLRKEEVVGVFEQLITYGKLTEAQITNLIPVITNFAAKQRISIEEATPIIIKALEGQARGLKAYGINVKDAHSVTERLGIVMDQLGPKVEGAADAFGKTTQGKIASTKEEFVRLKEELGTGLLPMLNSFMGQLNNVIKGMSVFVNSFRSINETIEDLKDKSQKGMSDFADNVVSDMSGKTVAEQQKLADSYKAIYISSQHALSEFMKSSRRDNIAERDRLLAQQDQDEKIYLATQAAVSKQVLGTGGQDEDKKEKVKKAPVVKESIKASLDLEFELYKIYQARKLKILNDEQNDVSRSYDERMVFAREYYAAQIDLATSTSTHEIRDEEAKIKAMQSNLRKAKGTERNNLVIEIENSRKQIRIIEAKSLSDILANETAYYKKQEDLRKDNDAKILKSIQDSENAVKNVRSNEQTAIEASGARTKAALDKLLKDKKITQDFYDDEMKKSIKNMEVLQLQSIGRQLEAQKKLMLLKDPNADVTTISNQIDKNKSDVISAENQPTSKPKDKKSDKDYLIEAGKSAQDLTTGLVDIKYQKELEAIQKIIDLNNIRKEQEMKNIEQSTLSNQEKAAQMIILDKSVAANNKRLEREKVAIQIKQAKFDRDMAVLSILEQAAIAMFSRAGRGPLGLAEGIAISIAAAAQIAMIMAKPLPTMPAYGEGTDNHPGGPAIVGEKKVNGSYQKELVTTPDGKSFVTDGPMLMNNLPRGSKVMNFTKKNILDSMSQSGNMSMAEKFVASNIFQVEGNRVELKAIKDAVYETGQMTAQAMKKQRSANVVVNVNGIWGAYIQKTVTE